MVIFISSLCKYFKPFNKNATTTFAWYKINMVIMSGYVMRKAMRWKLLPINKHCYVKKTHDLNILKKKYLSFLKVFYIFHRYDNPLKSQSVPSSSKAIRNVLE